MLTLLVAAVVLGADGGGGLPSKSPKAVGMSAARLKAIDRVVARGIGAGGYPGAAVVVGRKGFAVWQKGFGRLDWTRVSGHVSAKQTIYDLASLTKVVATTTGIMILYDEGFLDLDAPVNSYLPEFVGEGKDLVTVRHLLEHRSGLPASRDLWRLARSREEAERYVLDTPLICKPNDCFIYSDLGAAMLGMIIEALSGQRLDTFLHERVFWPLGMTSTSFRPADSLKMRIAPTEVTPPRGYPLRGEVHDENAYALGGIAGHAGLFSTAADLAVFAQMMLNGGEYNGTRIVSDSTVRLFTRRAAGSRTLGWAIADGSGGSGRYFSDRAYGHTGYTGTSLWIDPDRQMFVILLTNRVHAARARRPAKVISDVRADLADAAAVAVMDDPTQLLAMPASFRSDLRRGWNRPSYRRHGRWAKASRRSASRAAAARPKSGRATTSRARSSRTTVVKPGAKKPTGAKAATSRGSAARSAAAKPGVRSAAKPSAKASAAKASAAKTSAAKAKARSTTRSARPSTRGGGSARTVRVARAGRGD